MASAAGIPSGQCMVRHRPQGSAAGRKEAVRADGMGSCAGVREAEPRDEYFMVSFLTPRPLHSFLSTIKMSQILWLQTVCGTWVSPS